MKVLSIAATQMTPKVDFNPSTGHLELKGRSFTEEIVEFYDPIIVWLEQYAESPALNTELHWWFEYFNTATEKYLLKMISIIDRIHKKGKGVKLFWYFEEEEEVHPSGPDWNEIINFPLEWVKVEEEDDEEL